ncbi:hypothetical protein GGTG_05513 [Gaeumannomyces tritici R3-111a-1]|uniref:Uncharacterized protein n=1 Tax=Gaeumannomyces tritici (strain R3-111a-1) TaxID=644352 RepID=J3NW48_GAET3|nr:hypothetical protein GGTG_05513 [Gaeumannomyces tritici R3-111a-1]EJT75580.1 hypothetical protein GGTG_05513 [Gaeumannomyces tritici R3-111a-1]
MEASVRVPPSARIGPLPAYGLRGQAQALLCERKQQGGGHEAICHTYSSASMQQQPHNDERLPIAVAVAPPRRGREHGVIPGMKRAARGISPAPFSRDDKG